MLNPRIFIGCDSREMIAAEVAAHSFRRCMPGYEIVFLTKELCAEFGFTPDGRPGSTEFTYTRFLVPWLCGFKGLALFVDCDVLMLREPSPVGAEDQSADYDLHSLSNSLDMTQHALAVVPHFYVPSSSSKMDGQRQHAYFRKLWSAVMLLHCERLEPYWPKEVVEKESPALLHGFTNIPTDEIGELPAAWHCLEPKKAIGLSKPIEGESGLSMCHDEYKAILFHYTEGGPWFEKYAACPFSGRWYEEFELIYGKGSAETFKNCVRDSGCGNWERLVSDPYSGIIRI